MNPDDDFLCWLAAGHDEAPPPLAAAEIDQADEVARREILAAGAMHPDRAVRRHIALALVTIRDDDVREVFEWLAHDEDEMLAVLAVKYLASGDLSSESLGLTHLLDLAGRTPSSLNGLIPPATTARDALLAQALQTVDALPDEVAMRSFLEEVAQRDRLAAAQPSISQMALVPGGSFIKGVAEDRSGLPGWFGLEDVSPSSRIELPAFYIDSDLVTNREYAEFVRSVEDDGHVFCHYDESSDYDHRQSTSSIFSDPDAPAVGVSWYDAFAFAAWRGKALPTEDEWEKACRGPDGTRFAWGNEYDPAHAESAFQWMEFQPSSVEEWQHVVADESLRVVDRGLPRHLKKGRNASAYGVRDMTGYCWEWTHSLYLTGDEPQPRFRGLQKRDYIGVWDAYVCVKGGSWMSIAEQLLAAYRGRQHLAVKSPEVGFRCVVRAARSAH